MKRPLVLIRRLSQIFFILVFIYAIWPSSQAFTGLPLLDIFFKASPFLVITTFISKKVLLDGFIFALGLIIFTLVLGRFFCGWLCPLGTCIDISAAFRKIHPDLGDRNNVLLRRIKFYLLGILIVFVLLGNDMARVFDPLAIMRGFVSLNFIPMLKGILSGVKTSYFADHLIPLFIFTSICISSLILQRFWCRSLCPLGAIYAFLGRFALLHRRVEKCAGCKKCKSHCRMGAIRDDLDYIQGECILCMDCLYDCPTNLTRFKFILSRDMNGQCQSS